MDVRIDLAITYPSIIWQIANIMMKIRQIRTWAKRLRNSPRRLGLVLTMTESITLRACVCPATKFTTTRGADSRSRPRLSKICYLVIQAKQRWVILTSINELSPRNLFFLSLEFKVIAIIVKNELPKLWCPPREEFLASDNTALGEFRILFLSFVEAVICT